MKHAILVAILLRALALAEDATVPGEVRSPHPTLIHLSIEWQIEGDDDLDGRVSARFRKVGERAWRKALPLRRVPAGTSQGTDPIHEWANKFAGSLFGLSPDTEYEVELSLVDPDGGRAKREIRARTRPVPRRAEGASVRPATPADVRAVLAAAKPGDVVRLGAGRYAAIEVPTDGEIGRPLVIEGTPEACVADRVSLAGRSHVYVESLVVDGRIDLVGATDCVVRRCTVRPGRAHFGIGAPSKPGAVDCYIADNVVLGTTPWVADAMGAEGANHGEGILVTGPGNVVCFNRVEGFRDCISTLEEDIGEQVSIDIYGNDIAFGADDAIEADFAMSNCRIVGNRITNSFVGLSSQPGLGGPTYFVRNVMYNLTHCSFKLHRFSQGDVCLHNTVVKIGDGLSCFTYETFDHAYFRNNLAIGGTAPAGRKWGGYEPGEGRPAYMGAPGPMTSFDHDALGAHGMPFRGKFGEQRFESFRELIAGPHETHAVEVGLDVFDGVAFPVDPVPGYAPPDLRPRPDSKVVDAALLLPNVNDRFGGRGPDIGAYEAGQDLPRYGPRPEGVDEASEK